MKIRTITFVVGVVALATLAGCEPDVLRPSPKRSLALSVVTPKPPATDSRPDSMVCKMDADGGSYYVLAISAFEHDFTVCLGATTYAGTIDQMLGIKGMGRRCILGDEAMNKYHASVGIYSDRKAVDLAAARSYCKLWHGTN